MNTSFWPILLWQAVVWIPWIIYGLLNSALDHRYPIVAEPISYWILRHTVLCIGIIITHLMWFIWIASKFSPFLGMENTGYGAFFFFFIMWAICDFLFYWSLLGFYALRQLLSVSPNGSNEPLLKPDTLLLKTTGKQSSIQITDILWIEAEDYCCRVHTKTNNYLVRQSLSSFEDKLKEPAFLRIHRSTIVNTDYVEDIEKENSGRHIIRLRNGVERAISISGRQSLQRILEARYPG